MSRNQRKQQYSRAAIAESRNSAPGCMTIGAFQCRTIGPTLSSARRASLPSEFISWRGAMRRRSNRPGGSSKATKWKSGRARGGLDLSAARRIRMQNDDVGHLLFFSRFDQPVSNTRLRATRRKASRLPVPACFLIEHPGTLDHAHDRTSGFFRRREKPRTPAYALAVGNLSLGTQQPGQTV